VAGAEQRHELIVAVREGRDPALIDDKDAALLELRAALDTLMKELFGSYRGQDVLF